MFKAVRTFAEGECGLELEGAVVVGVSGGPDSLALMDVLHRAGYSLVVAHLDHCLRPESGRETERVRIIAEERGLPFEFAREQVAELARKEHLSLEEAAREVRYRFLFAVAEKHAAQAVAVGHTADDQVETVLMHLIRGSGLSGLRGMLPRVLIPAWSERIPLVRPLLATWRTEGLAYCQERGLQPSFDRSNLDTTYFRNRLRHEVLPMLEKLHPGFRQRLWRMSLLLAEEDALLEELTEGAWKRCFLGQGLGYVKLDAPRLRGVPLCLRRRVVRRALSSLMPKARDLDYDMIQIAIEVLSGSTRSGSAEVGAGIRAWLEDEQFYLATKDAKLPMADWPQLEVESLRLEVPGKVVLKQGWELIAQRCVLDEALWVRIQGNRDPFQCWLDARDLSTGLNVRSLRPGDRFQPLGMNGRHVKLAEVMINLKIPSRARAHWPLVCSQDSIVWLPGYLPAHPWRVSQETEQVVFLQIKRPKRDRR